MKETYRSENDFLLSAVRHGDQKAFDTLFRKYYPMLCAYGHRFVDLEDAEEIVEDSLLWIWENRETLVIESSLSSYLFKMVYRRALNKLMIGLVMATIKFGNAGNAARYGLLSDGRTDQTN